MDLTDIRRLVIIAMFSDDVLFTQLVLKGGNALSLVHNLGARSSRDVDLSLEKDFQDLDDIRMRIFRALRNRFAEVGVSVFDERFEKKPPQPKVGEEKWGGYQVEFKLMDTAKFQSLKTDIERARRESLVVAEDQQRVFRIQISKYEYCDGKIESELQNYSIFVYTPEMIAIEKLRAICQQMPEYQQRGIHAPRARDFYDLYSIISGAKVNLASAENLELVRNIFTAKEVNPALISRIGEYRDYHGQDWPSVELSVAGELRSFDFYFDFLIDQIQLLKTLWGK